MGVLVEQEPARAPRNHSPDFPTEFLWTTDAAGNIVEDYPSLREFTGQTADDLFGSGWLDFVHPEDQERVEQQWSQAIASGSIYETEFRVRRADGKWRHLAARGVPVREKDGMISRWVGYCRDVTEQVDYTQLLFRERNFSNALIDCLPGNFLCHRRNAARCSDGIEMPN